MIDRMELQVTVRAQALALAELLGVSPARRRDLERVVVKEQPRRSGTAGYWRASAKLISLNPRLLDDDKQYEATLRHEWAHAVCWARWNEALLTRQVQSHGPEWKAIARQLGDDAEKCHTIDVAAKIPERFQEIVCDYCHRSMRLTAGQIRRVVKQPGSLTHRACGNPIELPVDHVATPKELYIRLLLDGRRLVPAEIHAQVVARFGAQGAGPASYVGWYRSHLKKLPVTVVGRSRNGRASEFYVVKVGQQDYTRHPTWDEARAQADTVLIHVGRL